MNPLLPEEAVQHVRTASDVATDLIRSAILSGTLAAGTRLKEDDLAKRLGLSRTPVRRALVSLEHEGLVRSERNRGAIVREYDAASVEELYSVRAWLEGLMAYRAATRITPEIVEQLEQSCARFDALRGGDSDVTELTRENFVFHDLIIEAADSPRINEFVRMATTLPLIYKSYLWFSTEQKMVSGHFHRQITTALAHRDADRAEMLMREHLLEARDFLLVELEKRSQDDGEAT